LPQFPKGFQSSPPPRLPGDHSPSPPPLLLARRHLFCRTAVLSCSNLYARGKWRGINSLDDPGIKGCATIFHVHCTRYPSPRPAVNRGYVFHVRLLPRIGARSCVYCWSPCSLYSSNHSRAGTSCKFQHSKNNTMHHRLTLSSNASVSKCA